MGRQAGTGCGVEAIRYPPIPSATWRRRPWDRRGCCPTRSSVVLVARGREALTDPVPSFIESSRPHRLTALEAARCFWQQPDNGPPMQDRATGSLAVASRRRLSRSHNIDHIAAGWSRAWDGRPETSVSPHAQQRSRFAGPRGSAGLLSRAFRRSRHGSDDQSGAGTKAIGTDPWPLAPGADRGRKQAAHSLVVRRSPRSPTKSPHLDALLAQLVKWAPTGAKSPERRTPPLPAWCT
jgi:hypothetical protein